MATSRRWTVGAVVLGTVLVIAALWWFAWVPNWRPALRAGERFGIDVSSHQGAVDWPRVQDDDIDFVYIKATEGRDFVDGRFDENWSRSGDAGLERGAYHFFTLCSSGRDQAAHFLRVAPPDDAALAPAVDLELAGNCSRRPSAVEVRDELDEFVSTVEAAWDRELVLYVGDDFEERYPGRQDADRPLWLRRFLVRPEFDGWTIWQLHGYAKVDGVEGSVDLNVGRGLP